MPRAPGKASLLVVFLTVFIDLLGFGMVLPLLPIYARECLTAFDRAEQGWLIGLLMSSFSLMQLLFAPVWGRVSDRVGRKPVLLLGLAGSCVFYALFGVATMYKSLAGLFLARIGAGIAGATISTAQAYIADVTAAENRARGMALIGAAFGLGFTFGPLLGALALVFSPQTGLSPWPGYLASGLSAASLLLAIARLVESLPPERRSHARQWFTFGKLKGALAGPSISGLLLCSFVSIFSFANFESTLSLLLGGREEESAVSQPADSPEAPGAEPNADPPEGNNFGLGQRGVLYVFAFIGLTLTFAQGVLVRRLAKRISEGPLAIGGACISLAGFVLLAAAARALSLPLFFAALVVEVTGFAMITPSINSLLSRRTDPQQQGGILGLGQTAGALARILGPIVGIRLFYVDPTWPYVAASGLMIAALGLIAWAVKSGHDWQGDAE